MKTERRLEILSKMLNIFEHKPIFHSGLCSSIISLTSDDTINISEQRNMFIYIQQNRPKPGNSLYIETRHNSGYFWNIGMPKPRIQWLEQQIIIENLKLK